MTHRYWGRTLRRLVHHGLIEPAAALGGRVTVEAASRSNDVGIVAVDGSAKYIVKHHRPRVDGDDACRAEAAAYRWLARDPATAAIAPTLLLDDDGVLVLEAFAGARSLHEAAVGGPGELAPRLADLGVVLGILHSAQADEGDLVDDPPWILAVARGVVPEGFASDPGVGELVAEVASDPVLRSPIEELADAWAPTSPIHGDVKFDNVLCGDGRSSVRPLQLIDWELAGRGVPEWDLAGVLDGLAVPALVGAGDPADRLAHTMPALEAYRARLAGGRTIDDSLLTAATTARLVQSAIQLHAMRHDFPECSSGSVLVKNGARWFAESFRRGRVVA